MYNIDGSVQVDLRKIEGIYERERHGSILLADGPPLERRQPTAQVAHGTTRAPDASFPLRHLRGHRRDTLPNALASSLRCTACEDTSDRNLNSQCWWLWTSSHLASSGLAFTAELSMGRRCAGCSGERFKGNRCPSISARTTIRCIGSTSGRPTFEFGGGGNQNRTLRAGIAPRMVKKLVESIMPSNGVQR